jgi:peptidoglycan/LPS O-acetylase OafA/YrhL
VIFFVLSGYLISGSVFRMVKRNQWSWPTYLVHRLLRLWIVLIPGLILCALWDAIGLRSGWAPVLYSGGAANHMIFNVAATHTAKIFFENMSFLQEVVAPTFGSDSALWSLSYEFWYYVLFPLGLFVFFFKMPVRVRILCGVLFAATAWFVGENILLYFPIWLSGTLLALVPAPKFGRNFRIAAATVYVPLFFAFAKMDAMQGAIAAIPLLYRDYALTAATFVLLWVLLSAREPARKSAGEHVIRETSRFSYTLYVAHTPLCVLLAAVIAGDQRWNPDLLHIAIALACLALLIAYAYGVASFTEFRTDKVRSWLEQRLGLKVNKPKIHAVSAAVKSI